MSCRHLIPETVILCLHACKYQTQIARMTCHRRMGLASLYLNVMQQLAQELVLCTEILQAFLQLQQKNVWGPPSHQEADELGWMTIKRAVTSEIALTDDSVLRIVQGRQCECGETPKRAIQP